MHRVQVPINLSTVIEVVVSEQSEAVETNGVGFRENQVNLIGKTATWLLYASLGFVMVTHDGTMWPLWIFWAGFALAIASLVLYAVKARKEIR